MGRTRFLILKRLPGFLLAMGVSVLLSSLVQGLYAQPSPGDVFREYRWFNDVEDCGGALRVGGRLDYQVTGVSVPSAKDGWIMPEFDVRLENAVRAELVVEKMLCHGDTEGLRVQINGYGPLPVPEAKHIPLPQSAYAHHYNAIVPLPLSMLKDGSGNSFLFEVDTADHWWPQNLIYGMILRIYFNSSILPEMGSITEPLQEAKVGRVIPINIRIPDPGKVKRIDLVGHYEDADLEGDGLYRQWHYAYHQTEIYHHVASLEERILDHRWDTGWIPDQDSAISLAAFIHLDNGISYMTASVDGLKLERPGMSVELCKPYKRPKHWFTRNGEFEQRFRIRGDLEHLEEARMVFRTWSPGYFNGMYINDFLVFMKEGPKYAYYEHNIPVGIYPLTQGENILRTGMTPRYSGEMVHGVEVQWPGIMLKLRYSADN